MVGTDIGYRGKTEKNIKTLFSLYEEIHSMEICIVVLVWKLDIFSFYLLKIKSWPGYAIFALSKTHRIQARPWFTFCAITLEHFVVMTRPRSFWKKNKTLSNATFLSLWRVSCGKAGEKLHLVPPFFLSGDFLVELIKILENILKRKGKFQREFSPLSRCVVSL